jgi:hypothetical protein
MIILLPVYLEVYMCTLGRGLDLPFNFFVSCIMHILYICRTDIVTDQTGMYTEQYSFTVYLIH